MRDGNRKGSRFTLEVCRVLSNWIGKTPLDARADKLVFRPRTTSITPVEGHWRGKGDVLHRPDIRWPFAVECKCVEDGKLDSILESPKWPVWDWWDQAVTQAEESKPELSPLLIFSRAHRAPYAMLWSSDAGHLRLKADSGPLLTVDRPNKKLGEAVVIGLLSDLVALPRGGLDRLPNYPH